MRHPVFVFSCLAGALALSACSQTSTSEVNRAFRDVNVVDESNLNDIMLTVGDPNEAVVYFQRTLKDNPDRIDVRRGLEEDDEQLVDYLKHIGLRAIVVATKTDKVPKSKSKLAVKKVADEAGMRVMGFSSQSGDGRDALWRVLMRAAKLAE